MSKPMFMWAWIGVTRDGELAMSTRTDLSTAEVVEWNEKYRSYSFWAGQVPQC